MKLKLTAPKECPYRIILCDDQGNYVFDDVARSDQVVAMTKVLIDLLKKRKGGTAC